jgi:DNA mismatch repair protein MSH3
MAPKSSQSSQSLSQKSKQQTISSFFTPKPSQAPKTAPKPAAPVVAEAVDQSDDDDALPVRQPNVARKRSVDENGEGQDVSKRVRLAIGDPRPSLGQASATNLNAAKPPKITERTSKFLFSSSPAVRDENDVEEDVAATQKQREKLHEKFVKKLGRPDSFAELRRRNKIIAEDNTNGEEAEGEEEDEEEEPAPKPTRGKKGATIKKAAAKLTPMELQYLDIKRKHLDTVIVMEVGYKFKFFGEDARTASKELGIVCIPGKFRYDEHPSEAHCYRFASASFPVHRLQVHVKRLVRANHKVGVVRQVETAALKAAGNNRNTPFVRKLTNLYTLRG